MPGDFKLILLFSSTLAAWVLAAPVQADEPPSRIDDQRPARKAKPRVRPLAELSAGALMGLDKPLRGAEAGALVGLRLSPFEAGARIGGAYDSSLKAWGARFDLELGLGAGLRAIVGGLLLPGGPVLSDSSGQEARVYAAPKDWPNRFGIGASIAELLPRPGGRALGRERSPGLGLGLGLSLDAELVYTSYRVRAESALSGAAAFAAGVEARIALGLRWGGR